MVIKVAIDRDKNGKITWQTMYAAAIQNRLRADNNLSDIKDKAAARRNLGISDSGSSSSSTDVSDAVTTANSYTDTEVGKVKSDVSSISADITLIKAALLRLGETV